MRAKSPAGNFIYCLAASTSVGDAFRDLGAGERTTRLLVLAPDCEAEAVVCRVFLRRDPSEFSFNTASSTRVEESSS